MLKICVQFLFTRGTRFIGAIWSTEIYFGTVRESGKKVGKTSTEYFFLYVKKPPSAAFYDSSYSYSPVEPILGFLSLYIFVLFHDAMQYVNMQFTPRHTKYYKLTESKYRGPLI